MVQDEKRPWYQVLSEFSTQVQMLVGGMWTISFAVMKNLTKLDQLKDVLEQFNKITLDPMRPLLCTVTADIFVDDESDDVIAYLPKHDIVQMGGNLVGPLVDDIGMSLILNGMEYKLSFRPSNMQDFYVFESTYQATSTRSDRVLVNGKDSRLRVRHMETMQSKDIYDHIDDVKFTTLWSSVDTGEYVSTRFRKSSVSMFRSIERHIQFVMYNAQRNVLGTSFVVFGDQTLVRIKYPDDYDILLQNLRAKHAASDDAADASDDDVTSETDDGASA